MTVQWQQPPWWLEAGPAECIVCESRLAEEAMVYCAACDETLCLLCAGVAAEPGVYLCGVCNDEDEGR